MYNISPITMGEIATGSLKSSMSSIWDIMIKYVVPLGMAVVGYSIFGMINIGYVIDNQMTTTAMTSKFWKDGWGRLLGAAIYLGIGIALVMADGAGVGGMIKSAVGGLLCGAGLGMLQEGMATTGVMT
jgi:hypothetical protein